MSPCLFSPKQMKLVHYNTKDSYWSSAVIMEAKIDDSPCLQQKKPGCSWHITPRNLEDKQIISTKGTSMLPATFATGRFVSHYTLSEGHTFQCCVIMLRLLCQIGQGLGNSKLPIIQKLLPLTKSILPPSDISFRLNTKERQWAYQHTAAKLVRHPTSCICPLIWKTMLSKNISSCC